jgi:HEAT repeat protein
MQTGRLSDVQAALPLLLDMLRAEEDIFNRSAAAWMLGQLAAAARPAQPLLLRASLDGPWIVRIAAAAALCRLHGGEQGCPVLAAALRDDDRYVRVFAAEAAQELGPLAAPLAPALIACLESEYLIVRCLAVMALEAIGEAALADLVATFAENDRGLSSAVALVMSGIGAPSVPFLVRILESEEEPLVRLEAVQALGRIGPAAESALPTLTDALLAEQGQTRHSVAEVISQIGPAAVPHLLPLLQHQSRFVRYEAAWALGHLGPLASQAVPELNRLSSDPAANVRFAAVEALGRLGPAASSAVPSLINALYDHEDSVCRAAARTLAGLGEVAAGAVPSLVERLAHEDYLVRQEMARALGAVGSSRTDGVTALIQILRHDQREMRGVAAEALGKIGRPLEQVLPALKAALSDRAWNVAQAAAAALGRIGPPALDLLVHVLENERGNIRGTLIEEIGNMGAGAAPAVPTLVALLHSDDAYLRHISATALAQIGMAAVPALVQEVRSADRHVCLATARALSAIGRPALPALLEALAADEADLCSGPALAIGYMGQMVVAPLRQLLCDEFDIACQEESLAALVTALAHPERAVRTLAGLALAGSGPGAITHLARILAHPDIETRRVAVWTLGVCGMNLAIAPAARIKQETLYLLSLLIEAQHNPAAPVRLLATEGLAGIGRAVIDSSVVDNAILLVAIAGALFDGLFDDTRAVQTAALQGLDLLNDHSLREGLAKMDEQAEGVIELLSLMAGDEAEEIRRAAADVLGNLGPVAAPALDSLRTALGDEHRAVRRAAAWALGQMGELASETVDQLASLLHAEHQDERYAATRALERIDTPDARAALQEAE